MGLERMSFELVTGHIIIESGGRRALVDTGAPNCIGGGEWEFLGRPVTLCTDPFGTTPETLSQWVGTHIDLLMGVDVLGDYHMLIEPDSMQLTFSTEPLQVGGAQVKVEKLQGLPIAPIVIAGQPAHVFVDTGAKLSYLSPSIATQFERVGVESDFHPSVGAFEAPMYAASLSIGGEAFSFACGVLPRPLLETLALADVDGVVGTQLLASHDVCFGLPTANLQLRPR